MKWIFFFAILCLASLQTPPNCIQTLCQPAGNKTNSTCYKKWSTYENYFFTVGDFYYTDPNEHGSYCPMSDPLFTNLTLNWKNKLSNGSPCNYSLQCLSTYCNSTNYCSKLGGRGDHCNTLADCALSFQCAGNICVEGRPIGLSCTNNSDCDIITSQCYNSKCTAYFSLAVGSNVSSSQEFLCSQAIEIQGICMDRSTLPILTMDKGKHYKECKSDADCVYTKGTLIGFNHSCLCAQDSAALPGVGYCVYGGGEKELIDAYKLVEKVYYQKPLPVIKALMSFTRRDGHILFENPAKCTQNAYFKKSGSERFYAMAILALAALLI